MTGQDLVFGTHYGWNVVCTTTTILKNVGKFVAKFKANRIFNMLKRTKSFSEYYNNNNN